MERNARSLAIALLRVAIVGAFAAPVLAQPSLPQTPRESSASARTDTATETPDSVTQLAELRHAVLRLPVAAMLAAVLAVRPRRRGTPARQAPVIQTQIILAVVGAIVMLVVGSSLARAFGIVGAAGLVPYRAQSDEPQEAGHTPAPLAIRRAY